MPTIKKKHNFISRTKRESDLQNKAAKLQLISCKFSILSTAAFNNPTRLSWHSAKGQSKLKIWALTLCIIRDQLLNFSMASYFSCIASALQGRQGGLNRADFPTGPMTHYASSLHQKWSPKSLPHLNADVKRQSLIHARQTQVARYHETKQVLQS